MPRTGIVILRVILGLSVGLYATACGGDRPTTPVTPTSPTSPPMANEPPGEPIPADPIVPIPVPPGPAPIPRLTRTRFLAFGDSLTAGTTSPALTRVMAAGLPESYPFKLLELLRARYASQSFTVENEGKAGEAAAAGVLRLPGVLRALAPEIVILLHGVNDISFLEERSVTPIAAFVNTMAHDARFAGAQVIICTLPPQRAGSFRATDPAVVSRYNEALRDVARGEGAILVDFAANFGDLQLIGADGLHPTEAGYARMAQLLFDTLRTTFEVTTP